MTRLQAFIDDSGSLSGDQRLFMAGYLNEATKWALFSIAWQEELDALPSIEYLKMSEAFAFKGQFIGWSEAARDDKLRGLARVIKHFKPLSFEVSVSRSEYARLVTPNAPRGLGPHFVCCFGVISSVARVADVNGFDAPIDFIFDKQDGVEDDMRLFFSEMIKDLPASARRLVRGPPSFHDDRLRLPLQAADMLAWHVRRKHETDGQHMGTFRAEFLYGELGHVSTEIPEKSLANWGQEFSKLPGICEMQSKHRWRGLKRNLDELLAAGYIPPHGTRWKNFRHHMTSRISRLRTRVRRT